VKLVYTHENLLLVSNARGLLEAAGIDTVVRNEYAGGGRGELPVFETWPELWVEDADAERAAEILRQLGADHAREEWCCDRCGESNPALFESCWHCGRNRP
jgi:hypothetical protein